MESWQGIKGRKGKDCKRGKGKKLESWEKFYERSELKNREKRKKHPRGELKSKEREGEEKTIRVLSEGRE